MSLAGALTSATKRMRPDGSTESSQPFRSFSTRRTGGYMAIDREQISLPVELLSTTNPLAYDAPDLADVNVKDFQRLVSSIPSPAPSSAHSYISDTDSTAMSSAVSSASSMTSPSFTRESSPVTTEYKSSDIFASTLSPTTTLNRASEKLSKSTQSHRRVSPPLSSIPEPKTTSFTADKTPSVPARAPSHTRHSHEVLARKRSTSQIRNAANTVSTVSNMTSETHISIDMPPPALPAPAASLALATKKPSLQRDNAPEPFGLELAQVTELVEEIATPLTSTFSPRSPRSAYRNPGEKAAHSRSNSGGDSKPSWSPSKVGFGRQMAVSERGAMVDGMVHIYDDEEDRYLMQRGLAKWGLAEYMAEIADLYSGRWSAEVSGGFF